MSNFKTCCYCCISNNNKPYKLTHQKQTKDKFTRQIQQIRLALLLICCCLGALASFAQQLPVDNYQANVPAGRLAGNNINQTGGKVAKVGLSPQDRAACQLPPIITQRQRHLPAESSTLKALLMNSGNDQTTSSGLQANNSSGQPNEASIQLESPTLSVFAPNVLTLAMNKHTAASQPTTTSGSVISKRSASDSSERLRQLRQLMASNNYDAYLVTPTDEHGMEYVSDFDRRLRFLSGFTGSNGYALVLADKAVLFTDGRYALQADLDLDCNWWLVVGPEPLNDMVNWLKSYAPKGLKMATDARLMPLQSFDYLEDQFRKMEMEFVLISQDLVDVVWNVAGQSGGSINSQGPQTNDWFREPSREPLFVHPTQFTGNVSWQEKLIQLSDSMAKLKARHYIISQLDDIAWLLNLRGNDIPMAPLFKSYLFISRTVEPVTLNLQPILRAQQQLLTIQPNDATIQSPQVLQVAPSQTIKVTIYVDLAKVTRQVREHLQVDNINGTIHVSANNEQQQQSSVTTKIQVELKEYDVFVMDIREKFAPSAGVRQLQGKLLINANANVAIHVLAKSYEDRVVLIESLVNKLKSIRNEGEVRGMRLAHWRDSLAISMLLAQLNEDIETRGSINKWTEVSAAKELEFYRSLMDFNRGQSFDSISAYGPTGAIVHYKPNENEPRFIGNQSTYLLDSGGQYLDGTTDITRTVHFGEPSDFQRETYTRVLMGAVDLMSLIFEQSKYKLGDLIARRHLYELGLDYAHGTGHGIGVFSMVHEAPWLLEHYTASAAQLLIQTNKQHQQAITTSNLQQQQQQQQQQQLANNRLSASAPSILSDPIGLQANMFSSVEPGYYKANDFGIRLENIVVTQKVDLPWILARQNDRQEIRQAMGTEQKQASDATNADSTPINQHQFLRFEPVSLVPFEPKLIKFELLSNKQKAWLNSYNLMVRLRMTQQINYYLAKIRNMSQTSQQAPVIHIQGTISTSRLYQNLLMDGANNQQKPMQANESTARNSANNNNNFNNGYFNFLKMDSQRLQAKLEQTHKWILAKTELIPLDVPQSLISQQQKTNATSNRQTFRDGLSSSAPIASSSKPQRIHDGQRLMLAYMSSLPFNDQEAGEALSELSSTEPIRGQLSAAVLAGRLSSNGSSQSLGQTQAHPKCAGLECDLWLLDALNTNQRQNYRPARLAQRQRAASGWQDGDSSFDSPEEPHAHSIQSTQSTLSSLMDMFTLSNGNALALNGGNTGNMWPLAVLSSFVLLQVALLTYMCKTNGAPVDERRLNETSGRQSESNTLNGGNNSNSNANNLMMQQQQQQQHLSAQCPRFSGCHSLTSGRRQQLAKAVANCPKHNTVVGASFKDAATSTTSSALSMIPAADQQQVAANHLQLETIGH